MNVPVVRGMTHDGLGHYLKQVIKKADGPTAPINDLLQETKTDVVVNYLPVGSEMATKWYVEQVLEAGLPLSTAFRFLSAASLTGSSASASTTCRSSAMTSRVRSARRSRTVC